VTRPACGAFEPALIQHRCVHCGWAKSKHRSRREALCAATGKIRHRTRASAAKQLNRLVTRKKAGRSPELLMTYVCTHCRDWHVGHSAGEVDDVATTHPRHQRSGGGR
jgi:hypothetical protein